MLEQCLAEGNCTGAGISHRNLEFEPDSFRNFGNSGKKGRRKFDNFRKCLESSESPETDRKVRKNQEKVQNAVRKEF